MGSHAAAVDPDTLDRQETRQYEDELGVGKAVSLTAGHTPTDVERLVSALRVTLGCH